MMIDDLVSMGPSFRAELDSAIRGMLVPDYIELTNYLRSIGSLYSRCTTAGDIISLGAARAREALKQIHAANARRAWSVRESRPGK